MTIVALACFAVQKTVNAPEVESAIRRLRLAKVIDVSISNDSSETNQRFSYKLKNGTARVRSEDNGTAWADLESGIVRGQSKDGRRVRWKVTEAGSVFAAAGYFQVGLDMLLRAVGPFSAETPSWSKAKNRVFTKSYVIDDVDNEAEIELGDNGLPAKISWSVSVYSDDNVVTSTTTEKYTWRNVTPLPQQKKTSVQQ